MEEKGSSLLLEVLFSFFARDPQNMCKGFANKITP